VAGRQASFARDHEYKRHGTLKPVGGHQSALRQDLRARQGCHRSGEFIEFLKLLDAAYPASTAIKRHFSSLPHASDIAKITKPMGLMAIFVFSIAPTIKVGNLGG
jgi:hypothetical protein